MGQERQEPQTSRAIEDVKDLQPDPVLHHVDLEFNAWDGPLIQTVLNRDYKQGYDPPH